MTTHDDIKMTCDLCRRELSMCICALGSEPLDTLEDAVERKANRHYIMMSKTWLDRVSEYLDTGIESEGEHEPEHSIEARSLLTELTQAINGDKT